MCVRDGSDCVTVRLMVIDKIHEMSIEIMKFMNYFRFRFYSIAIQTHITSCSIETEEFLFSIRSFSQGKQRSDK